MRRLRGSFRARASLSSFKSKSEAAASASPSGSSVKSVQFAAGSVAKPAPPRGKPPAPGAKTAAAAQQGNLANGQTGSGGGGDSNANTSVGGGASAGAESKDYDSRQPTPASSAAEDASTRSGKTPGVPPAIQVTTDTASTVEQLASQIAELRAELASLRVTIQSLESRMSQGLTPPRRLPRTTPYKTETQSLVTSTISLEEGPNCVLKDEEFYDALAISLMHLEAEDDKREELRKKKDEEKQEELRRRKEQEVSDDTKKTQEEVDASRQNVEKESQYDDKTKDREEKEKSDENSRDEKSDSPAPSDSSQQSGDHQKRTAPKSPPPKPLRSPTTAAPPDHDAKDSTAGSASPSSVSPSPQPPLPPAAAPRGGCSGHCSQLGHPLATEIDRVITEQLSIVTADVSDGWTLFAQQGDMRMYKMEAPADDRSVDPLKAVSKAHGVTARELCRSYWDPSVRLDWETTVDRLTVLARPDPSTVVCHQLHRRIWPAQQRDTVFWSHLCRRQVNGQEWSITVNHSISGHPAEPPAPPGAVRAIMTSTLAGRDEQEVSGDRRKLRCHVAYSSHVNPGGWAPTAGLRLVYKREYPRFLQRFTAYVTQKSRGQPVEV